MLTIGYAFSQQQSNCQISPTLFFNEADLDHLDWLTTLFPTDTIDEKLRHFVEYYADQPLLIIGGDDSCLAILDNSNRSVVSLDATKTLPKALPMDLDLVAIVNYDRDQDKDLVIFNQLKHLLSAKAASSP